MPSPPKKALAKITSRYRWHVDPLDGTTNSRTAIPALRFYRSGTSSRVIVGVVYNPIYEELYAASWRGRNSQRQQNLRLKDSTLSTSLLCTGFPVHKRHSSPNIHYYYDFTLRSHASVATALPRSISPAWLLADSTASGIWLKALGYRRGSSARRRSRRKDHRFSRQPYHLAVPSCSLPTASFTKRCASSRSNSPSRSSLRAQRPKS